MRKPSEAMVPGHIAAPDEALSGRRIVPASLGCYYPPTVDTADLLDVDFDQQRLVSDGLYLVELVEQGRVVWRGCRRFSVMPISGWSIDERGDGTYRRIKSPESLGLRIVGCVKEVYKPARRIQELAVALQRAGAM